MGLFSSPRRRRRAVRFGIAGVAVASLIFLGVHFSNPGNPGNANGPLVNEDNSQPKAAPFTKQDRQAVHQVLRKFVLTAVDRQDVGSSWQISAPSLREGFTRKQWSHGNLPVVPYPAANRGLGDWSFVQPAPAPAAAPPKPSTLWWAVPIALLGLIVFAPLVIGLVIWYRNRRAAREFARART